MKLSEIPTDEDRLNQLSKTELVQVIISQQKIIEELKQEIAKLKVSRDLDSQTSSKPPSTDLLKKVETQQVAQLVERPIEIVEYHRQYCQCTKCGVVTPASWDSGMIPGQDLGVRLQAFLGWERKLWTSSL